MMRILAVLTVLLAAGSASAQDLPAKGSASTLDVATWNIEWFGSRSNGPSDEDLQLENARRLIVDSDIDLWSVQEIDNEDHFDRLLDALGSDYDGYLGGASTNFKMGFIFKKEVIDPIQISDAWLSQFSSAFAGRPPLLMEADVVLPDTLVTLHFVALHMKCCADGYEQRREASSRIKNRLDVLHSDDAMVLLGDFNDELTTSITSGESSPYAAFVSDDANYRFLTLRLDQDGENTFCFNQECTNGSTLDHILITDELFEAYESGSAARYEEVLGGDYVSTTSDHVPVFARFSFAIDTSIEDDLQVAERISIYPNPAANAVRVSGDASHSMALELFDLLGRRLQVIDVPAHANGSVTLPTSDLPPGVYLVRVTVRGQAVTRRLVVAR